jgi:AraC-like DNA-binding protein
MDALTEVLHRVRLNGTLLYHYELGRPWSLALPRIGDAVFHYLSAGAASLELENGRTFDLSTGDFVLITQDQSHLLWSDRGVTPLPVRDLERRPAHLGVVRLGGDQEPISTMICGYFRLTTSWGSSALSLLPPVLHLKPDNDWLETILRRLVTESAIHRPGQDAVLSRITELLLVEVLRSWIKSLRPGEGGWFGALGDPHIGKALRLIHEDPARLWPLDEIAKQAGLGRSSFAARFTKLVGQPMHRYLVARRMEDAALILSCTDEPITRIAGRIGYSTGTSFAKVFQQHFGLSPGAYRASHQNRGSGPLDTTVETVEAFTS